MPLLCSPSSSSTTGCKHSGWEVFPSEHQRIAHEITCTRKTDPAAPIPLYSHPGSGLCMHVAPMHRDGAVDTGDAVSTLRAWLWRQGINPHQQHPGGAIRLPFKWELLLQWGSPAAWLETPGFPNPPRSQRNEGLWGKSCWSQILLHLNSNHEDPKCTSKQVQQKDHPPAVDPLQLSTCALVPEHGPGLDAKPNLTCNEVPTAKTCSTCPRHNTFAASEWLTRFLPVLGGEISAQELQAVEKINQRWGICTVGI